MPHLSVGHYFFEFFARQRISQTSEELDKLVGVRTRKINSKLRSVTELPAEESARLLDSGADFYTED